jgi:lipopolysaccharide transport system permease protein
MMSSEITIIEAKKHSIRSGFREVWKFRSFYGYLLKEISMKKFRGTILGFWWLIIRPLVPTVMAVVTFTFVIKMESYGLPYVIFYLSGFVCWNVFHSTAIFMPRTLLWMQGIMRKTYFPRILVPLSAVGPPLIELGIAMTMFLLALAYFYFTDGVLYLRQDVGILLYPICLFLALILAISLGMVTSVMALLARDVVFSTGYFIQMLMFLTPVIYPISFVPENYRPIIYILNPMAKIVETARWSITGNGVFEASWFYVSIGTTALFFVLACLFFVRSERFLGDVM